MRKLTILILLALALGLAACGGAAAPTSAPGAGDPVAGKQVFEQVAAPPCAGCHSTSAGKVIVGPSLVGVSAKGAAFIRQCITNPGSINVPGFQQGIMPTTYATQLTSTQIDDVVAYVMSLK